MANSSSLSSALLLRLVLLVFGLASLVAAVPRPQAPAASATSSPSTSASTSGYWFANIPRNGAVAFNGNASYQIFRNVMDFGAKGDGATDDSAAINAAIAAGNRCGQGCDSSTITPAIIYFPFGTYVVNSPIIQFYYTQFVGDATNLPTIKAAAGFKGIAVIDSDPYEDGGANWYTNQNNFFRQVRNFVIDLTAMPYTSGAGIHWQVAQATSLQNIRFEMRSDGGSENAQQGIFMDNGSGGFMTDLVFNGGNYGAFFGNQQFTTRNLTFNGCSTAIYMNWNWAWTLKSLNINNCQVGVNMSGNDPTNGLTVGSVLVLDSKFSNTPTGIVTAFGANSSPTTGDTLVIDNVDFTGSKVAVAAPDGSTVLAGGQIVQSWAQGNAYTPSTASTKVKRVIEAREPCDEHDAANAANAAGVASVDPAVPAPMSTTATITPRQDSASAAATVPAALQSFESSISQSASPALATSPAPLALFSNTSSSSLTCAKPATPVSKARIQTSLTAPTKPPALMNNNIVFERSKPQYEGVPASSFVSAKSHGAKGDGVADDTAALQSLFTSMQPGQIAYLDHGAYVVTNTVQVPSNIIIVGEIWPLIMASGANFQDQTNPRAVFQVGQPGDTGSVEMSDLIFETMGPAPGAIMVEWNVAQSSQGSSGIWDVHWRIGGSAGTNLQSNLCAKNPNATHTANTQCEGAFLLLHITSRATAYLENTWFWVADHELDLADHDQIDIYNGRGVLIESQGPVWLYGTSAEHSQLYNYQIANAQNVYMALIQTETPYMQSNPDALAVFTPNPTYSDPDFSSCTTESCKKAWGLRIVNSTETYMYGGGLYSFFDNYDQTCLLTESCQDNMVDIECSDSIYLYGLSTKASTNMVTVNGASAALQSDNVDGFCQTIALFEEQ